VATKEVSVVSNVPTPSSDRDPGAAKGRLDEALTPKQLAEHGAPRTTGQAPRSALTPDAGRDAEPPHQ